MFKFEVEGTCKNTGDVLLLMMFLGFEPADAERAMDDSKLGCKLNFEDGEIIFTPENGGRVSFLLKSNDDARIPRFHAGLTALCRVRTVHWRKRF